MWAFPDMGDNENAKSWNRILCYTRKKYTTVEDVTVENMIFVLNILSERELGSTPEILRSLNLRSILVHFFWSMHALLTNDSKHMLDGHTELTLVSLANNSLQRSKHGLQLWLRWLNIKVILMVVLLLLPIQQLTILTGISRTIIYYFDLITITCDENSTQGKKYNLGDCYFDFNTN